MKELSTLLFSIFSLLGCVSHSNPRLNVDQKLEQPAYTVTKVENNCEIRAYEPYLVASVKVTGDLDTASSRGFRALAGYIFGENTSQKSMSMTTPVAVSSHAPNERIAMTAPVTTSAQGEKTWIVNFSMPSQYTLKNLPIPNNKTIKLYEQTAESQAVIIFSGLASASNLAQHEEKLRAWIKKTGINANGPVLLARYNDPFTLPWNRRNELMIKVE